MILISEMISFFLWYITPSLRSIFFPLDLQQHLIRRFNITKKTKIRKEVAEIIVASDDLHTADPVSSLC